MISFQNQLQFLLFLQASSERWPHISQWTPELTTRAAAAISKPASPTHQVSTQTPTSPTKATGPTGWSTLPTRTVRLVVCWSTEGRRWWESLLDSEQAGGGQLLFYGCFSTATHYNVELKCTVVFIKLLFSLCCSKRKEACEAFVVSAIKLVTAEWFHHV